MGGALIRFGTGNSEILRFSRLGTTMFLFSGVANITESSKRMMNAQRFVSTIESSNLLLPARQSTQRCFQSESA